MASSSVWVGNRGTVKDFQAFNAVRDADDIHKAIKGIGTDEQALINIITQRSNIQRQLICKEYKAACKSDLIRDLWSDLSGSFGHLLVSLMRQPAYFDAKELRNALEGSGTDEATLIEILTSRNNRQKKEILLAYQTAYGRILGDDISSDTSGDFKKCLLLLKEGTRDENSIVDENLAKSDAQALYQAGEGKWGTDENKFINIICLRSEVQLRSTFEEYRKLCNKDIEESITSEMSGTLKDLLKAAAKCIKNTPSFFAERLKRSMKGAGTDEATLTRIIVSRSEIDLQDIKTEYKKLCGTSLYQSIHSDTSGDYRTALLKICGGDD